MTATGNREHRSPPVRAGLVPTTQREPDPTCRVLPFQKPRAMRMWPEPRPYRPFAISTTVASDWAVIAPVGELDLASAGRLEQEYLCAREAGLTQIALDLRQVDFIDATGLRVLLTLRNHAMRTGHALRITPPNPAARRIFEITGTRGLFDWSPLERDHSGVTAIDDRPDA